MIYFWYALLMIGAYLVGNISFAIILSNAKKNDITKLGSGNPGTMNMLRNFGFKTGVLTLLLDATKGAVPALIGMLLLGEYGLFIAGFAVVLGHIYPVFRKFKGGKGVACGLGVFLVVNPLLTLLFFVIAVVYLYFFDYGAIASFIIITAMTVIEAMNHYGDLIVSICLFGIFFVIFFSHRANFTRMLVGKENKANLKKALNSLSEKKSHKEKKVDKKIEKQREIG